MKQRCWSRPSAEGVRLCAAIESIHTIIVLTTVEAGGKLASGGNYMGPDFDLTFANDYSATKKTQEGMLTRSEVLSATKSSGGFAIDASFSGEPLLTFFFGAHSLTYSTLTSFLRSLMSCTWVSVRT